MKTIKDVFTIFKQELTRIYGAQEAGSITLIALTEILNTSKASIKAFPEQELALPQQEQADSILAQLKTGKPLQYVLGYTEFYGLKLLVNPSVLIPRPETEELVQWVKDSLEFGTGSEHILDIGTGSGCIAISLKKNLPGLQVSAIDISAKALQTAKLNAKLNETDVNFIQADILNLISEVEEHQFEIIVSNPPYVTLADKEQMHTNVTDFEPHNALFVPEEDPLIFYNAIADYAVKNLTEHGLLFFEINENLGKETVELLKKKDFKIVELRKDMSGRNRMIKASF